MSNKGNHFRTVMFGGFHKQDVLDFIAQSSQQHRERDANLTRSAQQSKVELNQLAEKYETAEAARQQNAADCERMSEVLAQRTNELEAAVRELNDLKAEHEKAAARLAELEQALPDLQESAQAYAELKDHTATIEMEAHRKAQQIIDQAQETADRIYGELDGCLYRVQNTYQILRGDMSATINHLSGELERGMKALEEAGAGFNQHDETMYTLLESRNNGAEDQDPPVDEAQW